jgi:hypothetical protein
VIGLANTPPPISVSTTRRLPSAAAGDNPAH